ncbi:unnamed protein product [Microthlaspi erraticum]|uniref:DUF4283 domain-containing protein n=1 Tax=Microthlaspi erraticum TaxID=1685480 RepID=A0A6D2IZ87_9BRAS|nr:unnamed protein product [Microthlaspi erraticum]
MGRSHQISSDRALLCKMGRSGVSSPMETRFSPREIRYRSRGIEINFDRVYRKVDLITRLQGSIVVSDGNEYGLYEAITYFTLVRVEEGGDKKERGFYPTENEGNKDLKIHLVNGIIWRRKVVAGDSSNRQLRFTEIQVGADILRYQYLNRITENGYGKKADGKFWDPNIVIGSGAIEDTNFHSVSLEVMGRLQFQYMVFDFTGIQYSKASEYGSSERWGINNDLHRYGRFSESVCSINTWKGCEIVNTHSVFTPYISQVLFWSFFGYWWESGGDMSQSGLIKAGGSNKGKDTLKPRLKITVPKFDNSVLIKGYSKTLIGRCMNPQKQEMKNLLFMLPRIWHVEGKVAAADLGLGRFQIDFDEEGDILEVLKMGPFHFDYWMLSVVQWEPVMDPNYPCKITFWVRALGVPLQYWASDTFMSIGDALGEAKLVDIDGGRVQVVMNGFTPLVFETMIGFDDGKEEATITLKYERLYGFCKECFSLCHDVEHCPLLRAQREEKERQERIEREKQRRREEKPDFGSMSYEGVVINGAREGEEGRRNNNRSGDYKGKGKGKVVEAREDRVHKFPEHRSHPKLEGEGSSSRVMPPEPKRYGGVMRGISRGGDAVHKGRTTGQWREKKNEAGTVEVDQPDQLSAKKTRTREDPQTQNGSGGQLQSGKKVRKSLKFDDEENDLKAPGESSEIVVQEPMRQLSPEPPAEVPQKVMEGIHVEEKDTQERLTVEEPPELSAEVGDVTLDDGDLENSWGLNADLLGEELDLDEEEGENEEVATYMQVDVSEEPEVRVEAPHQNDDTDPKSGAQGQAFPGKKPGMKKKVPRQTVGLGQGLRRRLAPPTKTPRKKAPVKVMNRPGKKPERKADDKDPPEGSGPDNLAV